MEKCYKVVRTPHDGRWSKGQLLMGISLYIADGDNPIGSSIVEPQHLHFISNEEIKEGDWVYCDTVAMSIAISKVTAIGDEMEGLTTVYIDGGSTRLLTSVLKIIASTDPSLKLPPIPQDWIVNEYVPSQVTIKEVSLEQELTSASMKEYGEFMRPDPDYEEETWYELKLSSKGEVIVVDECAKYFAHSDVADLCDNCKSMKLDYCKKRTEQVAKIAFSLIEPAIEEFGFKRKPVNPYQELEDAAKLEFPVPHENEESTVGQRILKSNPTITISRNAYKKGYKAHEEKSADASIKFLIWCQQSDWQLVYTPAGGGEYHATDDNGKTYIPIKQLYELWKSKL